MAEHKILIEDCEDAWDESVAAGVTSVADAVDYKVGAASAKISPDVTVAAGTILATEAMAPVDISDCQKVRLWIKSSVDIELGDLQILLDNHASCISPEETLDVPALSAGVWSLCDLPLANPESDTAIRSVGLKYVTDLGACDIRVDDVNGCIVTPNYAEVLTRGWYPTLDKTVPFKVDENGVQEVYDPKVFNSLVVYEGTATANGPDTSTITDTVLATKPDFNGQLVVITSGAYKGQTRDIDQATDTGGGKVHAAKAFDGTIVSGVTFMILSIRPTTAEVADIEAKLDHADHGLETLANLSMLYKNALYVDANPAVGSDTNSGSRESPYLTIQAAVNAASEYTTIFCADSRTGAAAVGFDENAAIAGVVINTNYITVIGCKLFGDRCFGGNVPITNSIANADYVFSGSGIGVVVCGFNPILANVNGDEKCIYLTGNGACAVHCDITQSAGSPGFIGIHLTGDDVHVRRCHGRWFDDDVVRLEGCVMGHVEESLLGAGLNGVHLLTGCLGCVAEHCDILANTVGVLIDAGATNNHICMPHFSNNTTDFTNNGGATNDVVDAHKESQIVAGQTIEQDLKDIYDQGAHVALCITQWGGFEDEILVRSGVDPAALDAATKFTPTLPDGATVWKAYLVMKFREIYCAGANFVATAGSVQVQKSAAGSWVTGITIPTGTFDVAAGASAPGDALMGNADVSAQVADGSEVEFQLVTLRSNADNLALRDVQFGLQIYFTI